MGEEYAWVGWKELVGSCVKINGSLEIEAFCGMSFAFKA